MGHGAITGPVLVTGATGFLGGHLVRTLISRGLEVRATGRDLAKGQALQSAGADFRPVDLRDRAGMISACAGVNAVVHSGALSSAWGRYQDFYDINVRGTENVIDACKVNRVSRLVHISSPSVMSRLEPQLNLNESDALPDKFVSMYSETKKLGEDRVNAAIRDGLSAVILRPKAIYGPGDNAIFPRLIEAAAKGRLPRIGDGETLTDLTHVDDVVQACERALERPEAIGKTYLIIGSPTVRIWDVITEVVTRLGHKPPTRKFTLAKAMRVATILETVWRAFRLPGEPPLTKYKAGILAISQTYDISAARRDLGYEPRVSLVDGIESTLASLRGDAAAPNRVPESKSPAPAAAVDLELLRSGSTLTREKFFMPGGSWNRIHVPATFAMLKHPKKGVVLFDTGYSLRFFEGTRKFPFKMAAIATPAEIPPSEEAVAQVRARGVDPNAVEWIVLSHFDPDHYGGLRDFPNARIVCTAEAYASVRGKTGMAAFKVRLLPGHLPDDLAGRLYILPKFEGAAIDPFECSHDLFGDGSIRLVELPGHAAGQFGAFVRTTANEEIFLAADSCWNLASIDRPAYRGGLHRFIAADKKAQDETYTKLRALRSAKPELTIVPTHCPKMWEALGDKPFTASESITRNREGAKTNEPAA